jgi:hypothetical protein
VSEVYTAKLLEPNRSPSDFDNAIAKLKKYKSGGSYQIPAKLIQAGVGTLRSEIHKIINYN